MDKKMECKVKNRSSSTVVYRIPEMNIRRSYQPGEVKIVTFEELEKLSYMDGGRELMANFLQITLPEVRKSLNIKTEIEYNMSERDVINLITNGSMDEFLDALDFAPIGVIDLIKKFAVELPMNSVEKRMALQKKTGFDVTAALQHLAEEKAEMLSDADDTAPAPTRRVKKTEEGTECRRSTPNYKIVEEE